MTTDLLYNILDTPDLDPPMGDLFSNRTLSECRSIWTKPLEGENNAPKNRIIHTRIFKPHGPTCLNRLGIRNAQGFHKCGSHQTDDWIVDMRILSLDKPSGSWQELAYERNLEEQGSDEIRWFDLKKQRSYGLILEIRRCGIDGWWTPWNLAEGAFILEGDMKEAPIAPRKEILLKTTSISLSNLPLQLSAEIKNGELRYRSPQLEVGFFLNRPGFSFFSMDQNAEGNTKTNILNTEAGSFHQGPTFIETGKKPVADQAVRFEFEGTVSVTGNQIQYILSHSESGQSYNLTWTVFPDRLELSAQRKGAAPTRAWHSAAWKISTRPTISPVHAIGPLVQDGQTGLVAQPACLDIPNYGSLALESNGAGHFRTEADRPHDRVDWEFKLGESPTPVGDWLLAPGEQQATWILRVTHPNFQLKPSTPEPVNQALTRAAYTALTFRPDIGSLSNSGASMVCPISMDTWSAQTTRMGEILPGYSANETLRNSLERWLDGGPGYASGNLRANGAIHQAEDEYLMTGAAALKGLADYLNNSLGSTWSSHFELQIRQKLSQMLARDVDGDGLIESPYRTGTSGSGQWSTCWFDVISYGWKDAFTNAILYDALTTLSKALQNGPMTDWAIQSRNWAKKLKASYWPTFYNAATNRIVGWVCKDGKMHDHAFLPPNGAAIAAGLTSPKAGRSIMCNLLKEMKKVGMPSAQRGLPGNLHPIPDEDLSDIIQGYPFGYYQNGGRTLAQSCHFLRGLYAVGFEKEGDHFLEELCLGITSGHAYGGNKSGVDWRYWDGRPSGYEGLLTDQFGVLAVALERYGRE